MRVGHKAVVARATVVQAEAHATLCAMLEQRDCTNQ